MISVIIRALNEEKFLGECLSAIEAQSIDQDVEIVLVDSGSIDNTVPIALSKGARIVSIKPEDFTFGKSLNLGCQNARGDILVFLSAHCIPTGTNWLEDLTKPILFGQCELTYGRQVGRYPYTKFSEEQIFSKYFPSKSAIPQEGFFCNNANSAVRRQKWEKYQFDESLTGLEDMAFAKILSADKQNIGYVAEACVEHIHEETWDRVQVRFEREALALKSIMPEILFTIPSAIQYFFVAVFGDIVKYINTENSKSISEIMGIVIYRFHQFYGSWKGNNLSRHQSRINRKNYYYPRVKGHENEENCRLITNEGK